MAILSNSCRGLVASKIITSHPAVYCLTFPVHRSKPCRVAKFCSNVQKLVLNSSRGSEVSKDSTRVTSNSTEMCVKGSPVNGRIDGLSGLDFVLCETKEIQT